jgi:hypothetical protein
MRWMCRRAEKTKWVPNAVTPMELNSLQKGVTAKGVWNCQMFTTPEPKLWHPSSMWPGALRMLGPKNASHADVEPCHYVIRRGSHLPEWLTPLRPKNTAHVPALEWVGSRPHLMSFTALSSSSLPFTASKQNHSPANRPSMWLGRSADGSAAPLPSKAAMLAEADPPASEDCTAKGSSERPTRGAVNERQQGEPVNQ